MHGTDFVLSEKRNKKAKEQKKAGAFFRMDKEPSLSNCPWGTCFTAHATLLWVFKQTPGAVFTLPQRKEDIFPYKIPQLLFFIYFSSETNVPCIFQCNIMKSSCIFSVVRLIHMLEAKIKYLLYLDNTEQYSQIYSPCCLVRVFGVIPFNVIHTSGDSIKWKC